MGDLDPDGSVRTFDLSSRSARRQCCARKELTRFDQDATVLDRQSDIGWSVLEWRGLKLGNGSRSESETCDLQLQPAVQQLFRTRILPKCPPQLRMAVHVAEQTKTQCKFQDLCIRDDVPSCHSEIWRPTTSDSWPELPRANRSQAQPPKRQGPNVPPDATHRTGRLASPSSRSRISHDNRGGSAPAAIIDARSARVPA